MGISVEMITILIPIRAIVLKYKGGWEAFFGEQSLPEADGFTRDEYMVRAGAMDPMVAEMILEDLRSNGLKPMTKKAGAAVWNDVCVLTSEGQTLPCKWLHYDRNAGVAHYAEKGRIYPSRFYPYRADPSGFDERDTAL